MLLNTRKMQIKAQGILHIISMALTKTPPKQKPKQNKQKRLYPENVSVIQGCRETGTSGHFLMNMRRCSCY